MSCAFITPSFGVMSIDREELRAWLRAVLLHLGWTGTELARRMGKPPSTSNFFRTAGSLSTRVPSAATW